MKKDVLSFLRLEGNPLGRFPVHFPTNKELQNLPCRQTGTTMWTVSKELRWEAAHRLVGGYTGKCANNHGHSYVAQVVLALRPGASLNPYGMLRDFGDFKPLCDWIEAYWDHATLVAEADESLRSWLEANQQKYYTFPTNPTSEVLAQTLFGIASQLLNDERCVVSRVCIRETCTSEAIFEG